MIHKVKALTAKPDDFISILGILMMEEKKKNSSCNLSTGVLKYATACTSPTVSRYKNI